MRSIGLVILVLGIGLIILGLLLIFAEKIPFLGDLPGDIHIQRGGTSLFLPITSCILLSIILTLIVNLLRRFF